MTFKLTRTVDHSYPTDQNLSPPQRNRPTSRSPTPGVNSPRSRQSKSPQHSQHHPQQLSQSSDSKYSRDDKYKQR